LAVIIYFGSAEMKLMKSGIKIKSDKTIKNYE